MDSSLYNKEMMQKDFLKELANIGIGHAATSLAKMINLKVDISLPQLSIIPVDNLVAMKASEVCATTTGLDGDLKGLLAIVFTSEQSFWIIDKISGNPDGTTTEYDEMGKSAMKEFCNIIGGAFLTSLSNFLQFDLMPKIPDIMIGKGYEIKETFKQVMGKDVQEVLSVKTELLVGSAKLDGDMHLILDKASFGKLFDKMYNM